MLPAGTERVGSVYVTQSKADFTSFVENSSTVGLETVPLSCTLTDLGQQLTVQLNNSNVNVVFRKVAASNGADNKDYDIGYVVVENNVSKGSNPTPNAKFLVRVSRV